MLDKNDLKAIQDMINASIQKQAAFVTRKFGDTPTDDNQLVPKKYVDNNAGAAGGPDGSIQFNNGGTLDGSDALTFVPTNPPTLSIGNRAIGTQAFIKTPDETGTNVQAVDLIVESGESTGSGGIAGDLTLQAGQSNSNIDAADAYLIAGSSNGTAPGGNVNIIGGQSTGTSTQSGDVFLRPGQKSLTGEQGDVIVAPLTALATGDNGGFFVIPTVVGTPTGTPRFAGSMLFDLNIDKLWVFDGTQWVGVLLT